LLPEKPLGDLSKIDFDLALNAWFSANSGIDSFISGDWNLECWFFYLLIEIEPFVLVFID